MTNEIRCAIIQSQSREQQVFQIDKRQNKKMKLPLDKQRKTWYNEHVNKKEVIPMQKKNIKKKFKKALDESIEFYGKYGFWNRLY